MTLAIDDNAIRYIYERLVGRRCGLVYNAENRIELVKLPIGHAVDRNALNPRERAIFDCLEGYGVVTREEMVGMFNKVLDYVDAVHKTGALPVITSTVPGTTVPILGAVPTSTPPPATLTAAPPAPMFSEYTMFAPGVNIGAENGGTITGITFFAPGVRLEPGEKLVSAILTSDSSAATAYSVEVRERTTAAHSSIYSFKVDEKSPGDTISRNIPVDFTASENAALFVFLATPAPKNSEGQLLEMALQIVVRRPLPPPPLA